jgi:hypothetical protein
LISIVLSGMSVLCDTCGDLKANRDEQWQLPGEGVSVKDLKQAAAKCPNGGCHILLEAIAKIVGADAVKDTCRVVLSPGILQAGRQNYGIFDFREGFERCDFDTKIKIFVTGGT